MWFVIPCDIAFNFHWRILNVQMEGWETGVWTLEDGWGPGGFVNECLNFDVVEEQNWCIV